jgi:hypothetical protein
MADSFTLQDSDGNKYTAVRVSDGRIPTTPVDSRHPELAEGSPSYQLADGRALHVNNDGEVVTFTIVANGVVLTHADQ